MVNKLIEFQNNISIHRIQKVRKEYSQYKFSSYTKLLQSVGVNPIPIPKHERINKLENPINLIA